MTIIEEFKNQVSQNIKGIGADRDFIGLSNIWNREAIRHNYAQNFSWLGRPIIQVPQDIYAVQEIIWSVRPDLIIETGIAHGGSLMLSASMLALIDYCEAAESRTVITPGQSNRKVIGIDIDIRRHNREAIEGHALSPLIEMIEGSSIVETIISSVQGRAKHYKKVLVMLDSNHTHDHVLAELRAYAPLVSPGSYCVVWDSGLEDLPDGFVTNRPWGKGNNPKTAALQYLRELELNPVVDEFGRTLSFEVDKTIEHKIAITASPDGFLRRR